MSGTILETPELAEKYDIVSEPQFSRGLVLIRELGIKDGNIVLDVGCGTGRLGTYVAQIIGKTGHLYGIDLSEHRIALARRRAKELNNASFDVGTATDLGNFKENTFDYVYANSVIHHIEDKARVFLEIHRVLKKDGKFGMTTFDKEDSGSNHSKLISQILERYASKGVSAEEPRNKSSISVQELNRLFLDSGFTVVDIYSKATTHILSSSKEYIDFLKASSSGKFLNHLPENIRPIVEADIIAELDKQQTSMGIELNQNPIFAIAKKG